MIKTNLFPHETRAGGKNLCHENRYTSKGDLNRRDDHESIDDHHSFAVIRSGRLT